jgi:hypothetical protein
VKQSNPHTFELSCGEDQIKIMFYDASTARIWLGIGGKFVYDASEDIVVFQESSINVTASMTQTSTYYEFSVTASSVTGPQPEIIMGTTQKDQQSASSHVVLRATKAPSPLLFSMLDEAGNVLWQEKQGLTWNATATYQTLDSSSKSGQEDFFGGGMQNGRWIHSGTCSSVSGSCTKHLLSIQNLMDYYN